MSDSQVRLFATADLHGHLDGFFKAVQKENPDIVVIAGDLADKSNVRIFSALRTWRQFRRFCLSRPQTKFVWVAGNHDIGLWIWCRLMTRRIANLFMLGGFFRTEKRTIDGLVFGGAMAYAGGKVSDVDVLVYHKDPYSLKGRWPRKTMSTTSARWVLYGHSHTDYAKQQSKGNGTMSLNVSCWVKQYNGGYLLPVERRNPST